MPPAGTYDLVDRVLDGNLEAMLGKWRADGTSYRQIAKSLLVDHNIDVSDETIRRWVIGLGEAS